MSAHEKRLKVIENYQTLLGRNNYSQSLRDYCFTPYKDGKFYSDCSSSVSFSFNEAGFYFGNMTTVDMIISKKMKDVDVIIKDGIIENPEVLRIADLLLFAGNDPGRKQYDYVGHVEMVAKINGKEITLYGHGAGVPKEKEMNSFCKLRFETKAETPLGHRGLIRVRRFIRDDDDIDDNYIENLYCKERELFKSKENEKVIGFATALTDMNIRYGPGVKYEAVSYAKEGQRVEVLDFLENGWMRIKLPKDKDGFAFTSYQKGKYYSYEESPKE